MLINGHPADAAGSSEEEDGAGGGSPTRAGRGGPGLALAREGRELQGVLHAYSLGLSDVEALQIRLRAELASLEAAPPPPPPPPTPAHTHTHTQYHRSGSCTCPKNLTTSGVQPLRPPLTAAGVTWVGRLGYTAVLLRLCSQLERTFVLSLKSSVEKLQVGKVGQFPMEVMCDRISRSRCLV